MPACRALRLLRPLLARPAQTSRPSSSCTGRSAPPPCPPCESPPLPPCRKGQKHAVPGRRVVCCPPPQGSPPPCAPPAPTCSRSCENYVRQEPAAPPQPTARLCGTTRDAVAERLRCYKEHRRREYERAAAERLARPPPPPPAPCCPLPGPENFAHATDGQSYAVTADAPAPRCAASPAAPEPCAAPRSTPPPPQPAPCCPPPGPENFARATDGHSYAVKADAPEPCAAPRSAHPPPQPVTLAPQGDCRPKERFRLNPCEHVPRTLLSVDRSPRDPTPSSATPPKSAHESPKSQTAEPSAPSYRGLTSRIMDSLRSGRGSASPAPRWCANPPQPAPAPPHCRPPSLADRLRRRSPRPRGSRRLHTATVCPAAVTLKAAGRQTTGREATLAASEKLAAALNDREQLKEAGRGRCVYSAGCAATLPPPPRTNGGEIELGVPPGVDTVRVRVSMSRARTPKSTTSHPDTKTCPPPPCGASRPAQSACSDSWLSIKKLQKKISSSCGRAEPAAAAPPAPAPAGPCAGAGTRTDAPPRPAPRTGPSGACSPQGRVKLTDVLHHTIFVRF